MVLPTRAQGENLTGRHGLLELLTKTVPKCRWPRIDRGSSCFDGGVLELREIPHEPPVPARSPPQAKLANCAVEAQRVRPYYYLPP